MTRYFGVHTLEGEWHSLLPRYVLLTERVNGKRILDIGCGTGIGSSLLLELGAEQVNAIDHRPAVLELARVKHAKEGLDFHVMFWEELDFPDETFDMVLCLDPTSPVTDPSLLLEIKRVLKPGGEYVCAIERRNVEGMESLLPRYGYNDGGEDVQMPRSGERVPQLGQLSQFFETIVPVLQRPRYSYVFDFDNEEPLETHAVRKISSDESGLWVGDDPQQEGSEQTDQRPGRWIGSDERLCQGDGDAAAVSVLFCGDSHMPPPILREVQMPHVGLVDRLHQLISELQIRQHPSQGSAVFDDVIDRDLDDPPTMEFSTREKTSEFYALSPQAAQHAPYGAPAPAPDGLGQMREQLEQMTLLYQQMRNEMESLFARTHQELQDRDRYIEQLVDTVHHWQHQAYQGPSDAALHPAPEQAPPRSGFESEPTRIFARPITEQLPTSADSEAAAHSEAAVETSAAETSAAETSDAELSEELHQENAVENDAASLAAISDALSEPSESSEPSADTEDDPAEAAVDDDGEEESLKEELPTE